MITGVKMNRQHPVPETSPHLPSVTKNRPHATCWNAVTTFHTQLGTALSQLQCNTASLTCHSCLRTSPAQHSSTAMFMLNVLLFSLRTLSPHQLTDRTLQWSPWQKKPLWTPDCPQLLLGMESSALQLLLHWSSTTAHLNPNQPSPCLGSPERG